MALLYSTASYSAVVINDDMGGLLRVSESSSVVYKNSNNKLIPFATNIYIPSIVNNKNKMPFIFNIKAYSHSGGKVIVKSDSIFCTPNKSELNLIKGEINTLGVNITNYGTCHLVFSNNIGVIGVTQINSSYNPLLRTLTVYEDNARFSIKHKEDNWQINTSLNKDKVETSFSISW